MKQAWKWISNKISTIVNQIERERKKEGDIEREEKDKGERWERKKKRIDREIKGL